jgi:CubicO group peptidase (beta-lactamase class C family)
MLVVTVTLATDVVGAAGDDLHQRIDSLIRSYVEQQQFNGSALVASGGETVLSDGYGMADLEWEIPCTPDTRFRLGSITKQMTSMVIMQLIEEGRLSVETTLAEALPWYRQDTGSQVTIHQLLNHTSGIPSYTTGEFFREHSRTRLALRELVTRHCSGDLAFEPGSAYRYNNSGYVILGAVIEEITGKPYAEVLSERIFEPLGMSATGYDSSEEIIPHRAAGYEPTLDGYRNASFLDMSLPHAAGALYSTVEDLARWDRALYGDTLLSEAGKQRMLTPGLEDYGYGWGIHTLPIGPDGADRLVYRHGGGINGFNTLLIRVPEEQHLVVLLSNTTSVPLSALAEGIIEVLYGRDPAPAPLPIRRILATTARDAGAEAAIARYRELRADAPEGTTYERELNATGYTLLQLDRIDDAIAIFTLTVEENPESWNAHDSLAEAYAEAGRREDAIRSYARSLQLNPDNTNAINQLQDLVEPPAESEP